MERIVFRRDRWGIQALVDSLLRRGRGLRPRAILRRLVGRIRLRHRLAVFLAPKILGGDGRPMVAPMQLRRMADALPIADVRLERLGADLLVQGRPTFRKTR